MMEYSLQQRAELIIAACMEISGTNPYEIFHSIAQEDYVRIYGPEHHVLDGACILTAFRNADGNIDLRTAMEQAVDYIQKRYGVTLDMPHIQCDFSAQNVQCIGTRCPYHAPEKGN